MSRRGFEFDVPVSAQAPSEARTRLRTCLHEWGFTDTGWVEAATVVLSELVTNVVQHTKAALARVALEADAMSVRLSVADNSDILPLARPPDAHGGRGFLLIEALAARWQVFPFAGGKRVVVTLRPYGAAAPEGGTP